MIFRFVWANDSWLEPGKSPSRNFFLLTIFNLWLAEYSFSIIIPILDIRKSLNLVTVIGLCILGPLELEVR